MTETGEEVGDGDGERMTWGGVWVAEIGGRAFGNGQTVLLTRGSSHCPDCKERLRT